MAVDGEPAQESQQWREADQFAQDTGDAAECKGAAQGGGLLLHPLSAADRRTR
ncbi:hypothetical protein [Parafrankia sp. FMc2]|uniref:hypothetical protein n=1 Tax=Parafrankia sp. FMc2 TaxID=3233196 RepID=UPI0034D53E39